MKRIGINPGGKVGQGMVFSGRMAFGGSNSGATVRVLMAGAALSALTACVSPQGAQDWDLRANGASTTEAAMTATANRPTPDARGVISYPGYQVAVARQGDTVGSVATRVGIAPTQLAQFNALTVDTPLNDGAVLALPSRVAESAPMGTATPTAPGATAGGIEVTAIASSAIDRSTATSTTTSAPAPGGVEPIRHKVARGETAYSIARMYGVSAKSLAEWNGLGPDLSVHEGQYLLIPVALPGAAPVAVAPTVVNAPGTGSPTPEPPSASKPLPKEKTQPASAKPEGTPPSPDLGKQRTSASAARFAMPAQGSIIRAFAPKANMGIDIGAPGGSPVKAADDGTIGAVTKDTSGVAIVVIRHAGNLATVYANVDNITVKKGDTVKRGQQFATVRKADPTYLHFEVRKGTEAVDPAPYVQ